MLCPVCGERFGAGLRRCPTHDVELVENPPDDRSLADRLAAPAVARAAFATLVLAALLYGLASAVLSLLLVVRGSGLFGLLEAAQVTQASALPLMIASFAALGGIVLLRAYTALTAGGGGATAASSEGRHARVMGSLLAVLALCVAVWAFTDVVTSKHQVEHNASARGFSPLVSPPSDSLVTLLAINHAAYAGGLGTLAVMGGVLMVAGYERLRGGGHLG